MLIKSSHLENQPLNAFGMSEDILLYLGRECDYIPILTTDISPWIQWITHMHVWPYILPLYVGEANVFIK